MKRTQVKALTLFAAFVFLGAAILPAAMQIKAADDDSAAIKALINGFIDSFNRHDAHALSMWFAEDADFINVQQLPSHGRKDIEEHFIPLFMGLLKNAHRTYAVRSIRFLTPGVAAISMDYVLVGTTGPNGAEAPPRKGLYDWVVTKQNGKWLINVLHESELAQAPAVVPVH